jgi:hypothetical protein
MSDIQLFIVSLKSFPIRSRYEKLVDKIRECRDVDSLIHERNRLAHLIAESVNDYCCHGCRGEFLLDSEVSIINKKYVCRYCKTIVTKY